MSIFFYIIGYIVLSIAIAYYLKSRKNKVNEINKYSKAKQIKNKIFDRRKHNDYMNNPKFSYMSCNKYNPESKFYKGKKAHNQRVLKRFVLIDELEFERITNHNNNMVAEDTAELSKALMGYANKNYAPFNRCT